MSVFSDLLKNYIHEKNVKVMSLAHYCNLERSTVYKFINAAELMCSFWLVWMDWGASSRYSMNLRRSEEHTSELQSH